MLMRVLPITYYLLFIQYHIEQNYSTCLSIPEWEAVTIGLKQETDKVLKESTLLRNVIDDIVLKKSAKRLRDQADAVDIAMARFISDSQQVEKAIENDLYQVNIRKKRH